MNQIEDEVTQIDGITIQLFDFKVTCSSAQLGKNAALKLATS